MNLRVVSIVGPARLALADRGLIVEKQHEILGRIPLEDMAVLVIDGPDVSLSHQLLAAAVEERIAVVICDQKHLPNGILLPIAGHSLHTAIFRDQFAAPKPYAKRVWQSIIRAKITAESELLESRHLDSSVLRKLIPFVRSGDPDNVEAQAAVKYFDRAFGPHFRRDRKQEGINALLNYGYAVLRAAVARAIVGAGLHPALGVHHRNQFNAFCLADDAMEPLRTLIDEAVLNHADHSQEDELNVNPATKRMLISALGKAVRSYDHDSPLLVALDRYAADLRRAICDGDTLSPPTPLHAG